MVPLLPFTSVMQHHLQRAAPHSLHCQLAFNYAENFLAVNLLLFIPFFINPAHTSSAVPFLSLLFIMFLPFYCIYSLLLFVGISICHYWLYQETGWLNGCHLDSSQALISGAFNDCLLCVLYGCSEYIIKSSVNVTVK